MQFGYNLSLGFKRESTKMFGFFFSQVTYVYTFGFGLSFYGSFKNISLISSGSLIKDGRKPEYSEKNHLTYRCRTWHLTCGPSGERSNVQELYLYMYSKDKGRQLVQSSTEPKLELHISSAHKIPLQIIKQLHGNSCKTSCPNYPQV